MLRNFYFLIFLSLFFLNACALWSERSTDPNAPPFPPSELNDPFLDMGMKKSGEAKLENESVPISESDTMAQLHGKIEALETKVAILQDKLHKIKVEAGQPKLRVEQDFGESNIVDDLSIEEELQGDSLATTAAAAPVKLSAKETKSLPMVEVSAIDRKFTAAKQAFTNQNWREAANQFFSIWKENPNHPIAAHALYWAGNASFEAKNFPIAIRHWQRLEQNYPNSIYIPEAMAGLSRAYAAKGQLNEAKEYRDELLANFPDSPSSINFMAKLTQPQGKR